MIYQKEPNRTEKKEESAKKRKEMKDKWESLGVEMYVEVWVGRKKDGLKGAL